MVTTGQILPHVSNNYFSYLVLAIATIPSNFLKTLVSPMGNPNQKGIVAGQIYDPRTP